VKTNNPAKSSVIRQLDDVLALESHCPIGLHEPPGGAEPAMMQLHSAGGNDPRTRHLPPDTTNRRRDIIPATCLYRRIRDQPVLGQGLFGQSASLRWIGRIPQGDVGIHRLIMLPATSAYFAGGWSYRDGGCYKGYTHQRSAETFGHRCKGERFAPACGSGWPD
jgi:hypothetical protein